MNLLSWLAYLSVLVFYFVRVESSFTPSARSGHSAVLYESNIYFQGGAGSSPLVSSDFFYLNLSTAFDTTNISSIPWTNLTFPNQPSRSNAFSCVSGKNIFIFGDSGNTPPPVVQFDFTNQSWKTPVISALTTQSSSGVANQCLTSGDGIIYMFAGNVIIFNTANLNWTSSPSKVTTVQNKYNVMLPNGTVMFVGGEMTGNTGLYILYQAIWTYNTKNDSWDRINTTNNLTSNCIPTGSVLVSDGRIIIFGCIQKDIPSGIVVIDTKNNNEFFAPNISNQGPSPDLVDYTATAVGTQILIAFGRNKTTNEFSSNIYLMDVSQRKNFTWITSFDPKTQKSTTPTETNSSDDSKVNGGLIAGVVIGIAALLGIVAFLLYKRSKYMDSVRWGHLKSFKFNKSRGAQQDPFVMPYQETPEFPCQEVYTYNSTREDSGDSRSDTAVQDASQPYNLNAYESCSGGAEGLSRSSSVYSRQTDFDEENGRALR